MAWLNIKLTLDFINASRASIEDDLVSALIVGNVLSANVEAAHQHPGVMVEASEPGVLPDTFRRPVNAMSVALSLGIPRETARIKLAALLERGVLQRRDKGFILSNEILLSEPFMAATTAFLKAISDFVDGLAVIEACGVLEGDRMAKPAWSVGGAAARIATTHVLRGVDHARRLSPTLNLTTHYVFLSLSHLTGAAFRVLQDMPGDGGRLSFLNPSLGPVSVADVARFTRLPHETVRRHIDRLEKLGVVVRCPGGRDISFGNSDFFDRWLDFQHRMTLGTRQVVWKLYFSGVIVRSPTHGLGLSALNHASLPSPDGEQWRP